MTVLWIIAIVNFLLSLFSFVCALHCTIVTDRYSKSLKSWSQECVDACNVQLQNNAHIIELNVIQKLKSNNYEDKISDDESCSEDSGSVCKFVECES